MKNNDDLLSVQGSVYTVVDAEGYLVREDTKGERVRYSPGEVEEVDLSWYETTGNINLISKDASGNQTNKFSQQSGYTQIGITTTNLIEMYGNYLCWYQQNNASYPRYGVDFSRATEFKLPANTTVDGSPLPNVSYTEVDDLAFQENNYYTCTTTLTSISKTLGPIKNTMCIFTTGDTIDYTFSFIDGMKLNKPIELEPNKTYVIVIDNYLVAWSEFTLAE